VISLKLPYLLLSLAVVLTSIFIASFMQMLNFSMVIFGLGVGCIWLFIMLLCGMTLRSGLMIASTFFLKPFEVNYFLVIILLVACLISYYYKNMRFSLRIQYPAAFSLLLLFGLIALSKTYVSGGLLYFTSVVIVPIIIFIVVNNIEYHEDDILVWSRSVSVVALLVAIYGVIIALLHPAERIGSTWANAMTINGFYIIGLFFAIANSFRSKSGPVKIGWIIAAIVIFLGMIYTYTRIALIAVPFGLLFLMLKARNIRLYGIITLGLMPLIIPSSMTHRISMAMNYDLSIIVRLIVWYKAIGMILQHPLTGIGFSTWKDIYLGMVPAKVLYAQHAHNIIINLILEMGLIGFLAYAAIIISTVRKFYKYVVKPTNDIFNYSLLVAIMALLIACLTDIFIEQYNITIAFWITLALMHKKATVEQRELQNT
jgi:O-antigen ligase